MKYYKTDTDLTFVLTDKPGFVIKEHNHVSQYVVGLVLEGQIEIREKEKVLTCQKNDIFIIPVFVAHVIEILDDDTKFLSMCVGEKFLSDYNNGKADHLLLECTTKFCIQGVMTEENAEAFHDALDIILELHYQTKIKKEFGELSNDMVVSPEKNYRLEDLAKEIYVSKFNLIRKFKEEIGLTPHSFLVQNRIRKAKELLDQNMKITEVAAEVGFFDQSHFVKAFKSVVGITPSEYVRSLEKLD